jgi:hypothetical protein
MKSQEVTQVTSEFDRKEQGELASTRLFGQGYSGHFATSDE